MIEIDGENLDVICTFPVMYQGWECDSVGYIVQHNDKQKVVLTNHGRPFFAKGKVLEEKIEEYRKAMKLTKLALLVSYNQIEISNELKEEFDD